MDRRKFIVGAGSAALLSLMDPRYLAVRRAVAAEAPPSRPLEMRTLGRTGEKLSLIAFGGIVVRNVEPATAANYVAEAFDRGVNYYDVAPMYGNAEERLGPALKPYRDRVFLSCKTERRDAEGTRRELENSLRVLQTGHVDLHQLHHMTTMEEVEEVFAPGGAMEAMVAAKEAGKTRYLGFSAHGEAAALALLERFDFDTAMFPFNFNTWWNGGFGPTLHKVITDKNLGNIALKPMLHGRGRDRKWNKAWYTPLEEIDQIGLAIRFTANLPVHTMLPPGHWELFKMALDLAQAGDGAFAPLNDAETAALREIASLARPLFANPPGWEYTPHAGA
jgi:aryl-alcohol dehydrogenase-like predicted oxidoreductase